MSKEVTTQSFIMCKRDGIAELFKSNKLRFFVYPKPITKVYIPKEKKFDNACCYSCNRCFNLGYLMVLFKCLF